MAEFEKELRRLISGSGELARLREKVNSVLGSRVKTKEFAFTVSMTTKYSKKDIPSEITALGKKFDTMKHRDFCKAVESTYSEILADRINEYSDFLRTYHDSVPSEEDMKDACLLSMVKLSVLFNTSSDYMIDLIAGAGANVDAVCNSFDKRMHGLYLRAAESVMDVYNGMVFAS